MKTHEPHDRRWRRIVAVALLGLLPLVYVLLASLFPPEYGPVSATAPTSIGAVFQSDGARGARAQGDIRPSDRSR
ncbi:MAG TPA: hypothetical protein VJ891_05115 [Casimicrobiaceae bacterium]|nr:hypothetical protein [Casimicrobiaceae bacterium]